MGNDSNNGTDDDDYDDDDSSNGNSNDRWQQRMGYNGLATTDRRNNDGDIE